MTAHGWESWKHGGGCTGNLTMMRDPVEHCITALIRHAKRREGLDLTRRVSTPVRGRDP